MLISRHARTAWHCAAATSRSVQPSHREGGTKASTQPARCKVVTRRTDVCMHVGAGKTCTARSAAVRDLQHAPSGGWGAWCHHLGLAARPWWWCV